MTVQVVSSPIQKIWERKPMAAKSALLSPYEQRVKLVQETLTTNSSIDDVAAGELAVHVLHALNSIPERIR
jgi:hypothetical protein